MAVELRKLVDLAKLADGRGEEFALATVVRVAGSSYRKPGARMMITRGGQRAGTVSGGCLEGEVSKKIWWLTESGPAVKDYSTSYDDDSQPSYGLGCDGVVSLLMERSANLTIVFGTLQQAVEKRLASAIVTVIGTDSADAPLGSRIVMTEGQTFSQSDRLPNDLVELLLPIAEQVLLTGQSKEQAASHEGASLQVFAEYIAPPPALFLFGAGDDASPLVHLGNEMGWEITVSDGRSNLATPSRFPSAHRVKVLSLDEPLRDLPIAAGDAAVVLTHSYQQDVAILRELLPLPLAYLGVLGPKRRTARIVNEVAAEVGVDPRQAMLTVKSPVGLDLGAGAPEIIALSIVAEIQAVLTRRSAAPLYLATSADSDVAPANP